LHCYLQNLIADIVHCTYVGIIVIYFSIHCIFATVVDEFWSEGDEWEGDWL